MKIVIIDGENLLKNLKNFNEIFRKDVTYDNIESPKKNRASPSFYNHFHNILRLFVVLPNFPFIASETVRDYYL